ncbi:MAG: nitroreductase family protein [Gemmatimonadetes bacterium]|nr:nitroreductase family protein [Gemmatimonadota bacterium]
MRDHPPPTAELMVDAWCRASEIVAKHGVQLGPRCIPCMHNTLTCPDAVCTWCGVSNGEGEGGGARLAAQLFPLIRDRRRIRAFSDRAVPPEMIAQIVDCGPAAPSSKNSNPGSS